MGHGNVHPDGPYEGVFYIDNDYRHVYYKNDSCNGERETRLQSFVTCDDIRLARWFFDEIGSSEEEADVLECFCDEMMRLCPSFHKVMDVFWITQKRRMILENSLFYICVEDNDWSLAVELIQHDDDHGRIAGLQKRHYAHYLECMKTALLTRLPEIGTYAGAWTSGRITREENENETAQMS